MDDAVEYEYNPHVHVADVPAYLDRAARASERARRQVGGVYDVAYGDRPLNTCDIFPAGPDAPVHVFLHGGYWRGRDKADYSFMAPAFLQAGVTLVLPNYSLCPHADLATLVRETSACLHWLRDHGRRHGDMSRLTASGHSAGAHLLAMAHAPDFDTPVTPGLVRRAVLISGLYDLAPVRHTSVNTDIGLTAASAAALSPVHHLPYTDLPLTLYVGGGETASWIQQSRDFHAAVSKAGSRASLHVLGDHNHYSIAEELGDAHTPLGQACIAAALAP
ncbi:alpha/beta hydrolase [Aquisalimonas asiatica]|uniref:Arylformamidase n=1 Tax=Aquisalimonas asiatica TaxID=406100 RepID=A0A1H8UV65_9GAMM|nr:alpha/beta hydrolase [Aquisalimonas asiatica]SEP06458.1 arylformamidase [Aquisalimonas asiatica]